MCANELLALIFPFIFHNCLCSHCLWMWDVDEESDEERDEEGDEESDEERDEHEDVHVCMCM